MELTNMYIVKASNGKYYVNDDNCGFNIPQAEFEDLDEAKKFIEDEYTREFESAMRNLDIYVQDNSGGGA